MIHLRSYSKVRPYKCNKCDKSYKMARHVRAHMTKHNGQNLKKCDVCEKVLTKAGLKPHMNGHIGGNIGKPFSCTECQKCF